MCVWLYAPHWAQAKGKGSAAAHLEVSKGPGTEQCLDEQRLSRAVEARLRRRVFRTDAPATLYVQIAFTRDNVGWSALLKMRDGDGAFLGRRSLSTEAADCSTLDDSLALIVALLVDSPPPPTAEIDEVAAPAATATSPAPRPVTRSEVKAAVIPTPSPIVLPADTLAPREPWRFQLAAEGIAAIGMLPGFAPGAELGFAAKAPRMPELRLFAGWYAPREQRRATQDAGARFNALFAGLEVCPFEQSFGAGAWLLCAGQSLARVRVTSFGFDENSSSDHLTFALVARGAVQFALTSQVAVRLGARAELPLNRGAYGYGTPDGGQQSLFEPSPVAAVLDLGLIVRL